MEVFNGSKLFYHYATSFAWKTWYINSKTSRLDIGCCAAVHSGGSNQDEMLWLRGVLPPRFPAGPLPGIATFGQSSLGGTKGSLDKEIISHSV
jgi:hypothetical protein